MSDEIHYRIQGAMFTLGACFLLFMFYQLGAEGAKQACRLEQSKGYVRG